MIKFITPIVLHPDAFDGQLIVRLEVDFRTEHASGMLAPVKSTDKHIYLGVREGGEARFPEVFETFEVSQNQEDPDPLILAFFDKLHEAGDIMEQIIVQRKDMEGGIASHVKQIGFQKWSLDCTHEPLGNRKIGLQSK